MNQDTVKVIVDIGTALGTLIAAVVAFVKAIYPYLKTKITEAEDKKFQDIMDTVVLAAEQLKNIGEITNKLEYALSQAKLMLAEQGITKQDNTIRAEIESRIPEVNMEYNKDA